jgi:hypothetical protein
MSHLANPNRTVHRGVARVRGLTCGVSLWWYELNLSDEGYLGHRPGGPIRGDLGVVEPAVPEDWRRLRHNRSRALGNSRFESRAHRTLPANCCGLGLARGDT